MAISGLMLWAAPYLAYRISTGQLFEAVSSTASGWMAAIVGSAVELTGLKAGAALQRQAENTQTQGSYQAEMTRAKGTLEASNLGAQARKISSIAGIEGNRQATLAAIAGGAASARGMALSSAQFTKSATSAQVGDTNRQMWARTNQSIVGTRASQSSESIRIAGESSARHVENWGSALNAVPYAGPALATVPNDFANTRRTRALNQANNQFTFKNVNNELHAANTVEDSQFRYRDDMNAATDSQLQGNTAAIETGAAMSAGGANRGAEISKAGVGQAYSLEVKANDVQLHTAQDAASQIKDAGLEAAHLRELSTVVSGMAREMDRRIEEGMRQRY